MNRKRRKKVGTEQQDCSVNLEVVHLNAAGIDIGNGPTTWPYPQAEIQTQCGSLPALRRICTVWRAG